MSGPIELSALSLQAVATRRNSQHSASGLRSSEIHSEGAIRRHSTNDVAEEPPVETRLVHRRLGPLALFMITINAVLGVGFYWKSGIILELGGALAAVLSFLVVGIVVFGVMQCITEMMCIWPIPGAMSAYVAAFVDKEIGITVGISYWFTYSVSFAALINSLAEEIDFWDKSADNRKWLLVPLVALILMNCLGVEIYGFLEIAFGCIKIIFLLYILLSLIVIRLQPRIRDPINDWGDPKHVEHAAARNWATAFLMSISLAAFAYVGIDIIAAIALEARWPIPQHAQEDTTDVHPSKRTDVPVIGDTVKKISAYGIPIAATLTYTIGALLISLNIKNDDCRIPRLSGIKKPSNCTEPPVSPVVRIALVINWGNLAKAFNFFLVFTAATSANTNLYVASRTLFGLLSQVRAGRTEPWYMRVLAWFGKTNRRRVPLRATLLSAVAFGAWVPFLHFIKDAADPNGSIVMLIQSLSRMGSVGAILVWAFECFAYIRFRDSIYVHRDRLTQTESFKHIQRWRRGDYPYLSHGQPITAWLSLLGCFFILLCANTMFLLSGFQVVSFVSAYVTIMVFVATFLLLKTIRNWRGWGLSKVSELFLSIGQWRFVDLSNYSVFKQTINDLDELTLRGRPEEKRRKNFWTLWGFI